MINPYFSQGILLQINPITFIVSSMNHMKIAKMLWNNHIQELALKNKNRPLCLVDATCGNGHDSLFLAKYDHCHLHCIDVQKQSIENTKKALKDFNNISFHQQSHENLDFIDSSIDLIVYNLGYLPGSDKTIITKPDSTIASLNSALTKLSKTALVCLTIYTGHPGGKEEEKAIIKWIQTLDKHYKICKFTFLNKITHPYVIVIHKTA